METASPPIAETPKPKLRWFQYSLRSLFILTLLVAIGMSWLTVTMQNQRKQKAAAEATEKAGGWGTVQSEPTWLGKLLRNDSLVRVTYVNLSGESITNDVLAHLQGLGQLRELGLVATKVTDSGLVHLEGLSQLQRLRLDATQVTDAGLVHLQRLGQLQWLFLDNTEVTDAGLMHLHGLTQLQWLRLGSTKVTDLGVKKLQQALPNCKIER